MFRPVWWVLGLNLLPPIAWAAEIEPRPLSQSEAEAWIQHTVPLPKQIEIFSEFAVHPERVEVIGPDVSEPLVHQAIKELRERLGQDSGFPSDDHPHFEILFEIDSSGSGDLKDPKNQDQAYRIEPDRRRPGLRAIALSPRGLYYASKTMQQLLRPSGDAERILVPLLRVIDWPDMEDRGLWGTDAYNHIRWLSDRKVNYMEQIGSSTVDEQKHPRVSLSEVKQRMVDEGPTHGITPVPAIAHLDQLAGGGIFDAYPELKAQGAKEGAICYSNPLFIDILAEWLVGYAQMPGVTQVDVWLAENLHGKGGCQCSQCQGEDRTVLEARTIVAAYRKANARVPTFGLRILTSEETESSNPDVFEMLPSEIKIWYYHSLLTYTATDLPMLRPYLKDFAGGGRWIGVCPSLVPDVPTLFASPFTGAHFVHDRINEFVDKGLKGFIGYATPLLYHVLFNVEAAAEWSWNAKGRTPRQFAYSWAVRQGIEDPRKFAEWSETLGPVTWDVYGSHWPFGDRRGLPGKAAAMLKQGKLPELGFILWDVYASPWGDIKTVEQLNDDVARADRAVQLAHEIGRKDLLLESQTIQGFIRSQKALWELKQLVTTDGVAPQNREAARGHLIMYLESLRQAKKAIPEWESTLPLKPKDRLWTDRPVEIINGLIDEMTATAGDLGIPLP